MRPAGNEAGGSQRNSGTQRYIRHAEHLLSSGTESSGHRHGPGEDPDPIDCFMLKTDP